MDNLSELISLLNTENYNDFIKYLKQNNKRNDTKNIQLLKFIKTDDINSIKKLYKDKKNNDAYHALRKRLQDNLLLFLSNKTFQNNANDANEALKLLVVGKFLYENNLEKIANKCLIKAEAKALKLEQFSLLNEIYSTRLQYNHLHPNDNFEELSNKFIHNQTQLNNEAKLNIAYAHLRKELERVIYKGEIIDLSTLLQSTMNQYNISLTSILTYKSLVQILDIANEYAAIHQNYKLVESYIESSYKFLENQQQNAEHHLYYHIQILYYLANFSFRNLDFEQSFHYLDDMQKLMEKQNKFYYSTFYQKHQLILALNFHFTNRPEKALEIIENALKTSFKKVDLSIMNDLQATYTMFLGQQKNKLALKEISKLIHTDNWYEKKVGMLWAIRKNLMEILIHAQFEHIDFALTRIKSFKRRYKTYLESVNETKVVDYVVLVEKYLLNSTILQKKSFKEKIEKLEFSTDQDVFLMSYIGWLKSLNTSKTPYQTTLEMIKNKSE
ncbi:hypothetical protein [Empedobacter brevis]|uniref:hypothetical protein n=1 Tax=Empedobacter brevis TaxID=247 RepID=UPI0039B0CCB2